MAIKLTDLLAKVRPEVEAQVKKTRDQTQHHLREALRTECRLLFKTPQDSAENRQGASVPIEISAGHPAVLDTITFEDAFRRSIILSGYRVQLEMVKVGTSRLHQLPDELGNHLAFGDHHSMDSATITRMHAWSTALLQELDKHDPLHRVLEVKEDILGCYQYEVVPLFGDGTYPNRATIKLYWAVIGLVSQWLGCDVHDLTVVVLAHELAHAYTQVGADIDGQRWTSVEFARADVGLKEGLAQYYTERVLARLENRDPGPIQAYCKLLKKQSEPYRAHLPWLSNHSPEEVRRALIEVRRKGIGGLDAFNTLLGKAKRSFERDDAKG